MKTPSIYVITAPNGLVKIGYSNDARSRFETIRTSSPVDLRLVAVLHVAAAPTVERAIHERLASCRMRGEWFLVSAAEAIAVASEVSGQASVNVADLLAPKVRKHISESSAKGGAARAKSLRPSRRRAIARKAAKARWRKPKITEVKK